MRERFLYVPLCLLVVISTLCWGQSQMKATLDPISRCFRISYYVPSEAPDTVLIRCAWTPIGEERWQPAPVQPFISETALTLLPEGPESPWLEWRQGRVLERRAAGLWRSVIFNPYPEAQAEGHVRIRFRIEIQTLEQQPLAMYETSLEADNSDVIYIEDWTAIMQKELLASGTTPADGRWTFRTGLSASEGVTFGNELYAKASEQPLPALTYPLDLRGFYAIFVVTRPRYGIRLRLTGDERFDTLDSRHARQERLWRWTRMDRQHLVLAQPETFSGWATAQIDYIKFVPLTKEQFAALEDQFPKQRDKIVAGYFEPYSWAFHERVTRPVQHLEPLTAFAAAGIQILDSQLGRFGDKNVFESRVAEQLIGETFGDPIGHIARPTTQSVGLMQQYTNTCETELRYARMLGMTFHANFGATNCYSGTPLEGRISREHPEWRRGEALRYEVPEVQEHILAVYRETLEIGAEGLSLDFCRYPEGIDKPETGNQFLRRLRALADEYTKARRKPVPILVRFPAHGVRLSQNFDYRTWIRERLVDYLCPSNIQGRHMHFDITPYVKATRGTPVKLLPVVDGLSWGLAFPGPFLWRVRQLYEAGVDGIYIYQADARVLGRPEERRTIRLLGSDDAVRRFWQQHQRLNEEYSKGIYIQPYTHEPGYHGWERLRVWAEGIEPGPMEFYLDGQLVHKCDGPPYLLGSEEYAADGIIPPGKHTLRIRAKDGAGWLEQTCVIVGA